MRNTNYNKNKRKQNKETKLLKDKKTNGTKLRVDDGMAMNNECFAAIMTSSVNSFVSSSSASCKASAAVDRHPLCFACRLGGHVDASRENRRHSRDSTIGDNFSPTSEKKQNKHKCARARARARTDHSSR
jgi:hypothetical protein